MIRDITFSQISGPGSVTLKPPALGYTFTLDMAFDEPSLTTDGRSIAWDNGIANDTRICPIPTMHLNQQKQLALINFFDDIRTSSFRLYMGVENGVAYPTGWFPFGPDYGDYATSGNSYFTVYKIDHSNSGVLRSPWKHFNNELTLTLSQALTYTPPAASNQGTFYIGSIGLHHPQYEIQVEKIGGIRGGYLPGGTGYYVDSGINSEQYISTVKLQASTGNMAALLTYFQNTVRNKQFKIVCPNQVYLFGRKNVIESNSTTNYYCKLMSNKIVVTHERVNKFTFELKLLMVSKS
jgi:hypothetical protein